jgi:hypothetical protein
MGIEEIRRLKMEADLPKPPKEKKGIKRVSDKTAAKKKAEKEQRIASGELETQKEKWFKARRKEMVGICQCGCAQKSSKFENDHFRSSICHIFPQRDFPSIQFHSLNWVERAFWATEKGSSCHTNMDNQSIEKWPAFADWEDIKARFHELAPLLTDEERATKFYANLEKLVYAN